MADHSSNTGRLALNNTAYDVAKEAATLWLPALATFYAALAVLWGFPEPEKVVGTIVALNAFLGVVLKVSTSSYNNGKLENPDNPKTSTIIITKTGTSDEDPRVDSYPEAGSQD